MSDPTTVAIVGPTASGKSALSVRLALRLAASGRPAEVVNADSMLVYRGMDIGTAKPTPAERQGVVHHLVDIMDVTETASVADFQLLARAAMADCHARGVVPIVVGGSALYLRAILDQFDFPVTDPSVRSRLEREAEAYGPVALHARLRELDPEQAAGIIPTNTRRVVRALEIAELTGTFRSTLPAYSYAVPGVVQIGLALDRPVMDQRIADRVDQMWAAGLVAEVEALCERGLRSGRTASRGLGYRQVLEFLAGECTEAEAREATVAGTRRFSRKQLMWWRRDPRITWLDALSESLDEMAISVVESVDRSG